MDRQQALLWQAEDFRLRGVRPHTERRFSVNLPKNRRALPCKWVYRLKETSDSTTPKYKDRLVVKGFRQEYGVEFDEIFSPVVKMATVRFMLGVVAVDNLELIQLDVKTAFLHGVVVYSAHYEKTVK